VSDEVRIYPKSCELHPATYHEACAAVDAEVTRLRARAAALEAERDGANEVRLRLANDAHAALEAAGVSAASVVEGVRDLAAERDEARLVAAERAAARALARRRGEALRRLMAAQDPDEFFAAKAEGRAALSDERESEGGGAP
jgi:hypothetical protein